MFAVAWRLSTLDYGVCDICNICRYNRPLYKALKIYFIKEFAEMLAKRSKYVCWKQWIQTPAVKAIRFHT